MSITTPTHRQAKPRRCAQPGCRTWLSSHNRSRLCAQHGGWIAQRIPEPEQRKHFQDLLVDDR